MMYFPTKCGAFENPRILKIIPWKFNIAPEILPSQKRKAVFQPSFFRGYVKLRGSGATLILLETFFFIRNLIDFARICMGIAKCGFALEAPFVFQGGCNDL